MKPPSQAKSPGSKTRVAWLMPTMKGGFYWQPLFREFTKLFPQSIVFTGLWPGFLPGYEGAIEVCQIRGARFITFKRSAWGYCRTLSWVPPSFLWHLCRFSPQVIVTVGFNLCTLCALALKPLMGWKVILLWEGVSPTISYSDAPISLMARRIMGPCFDATITNTREGMDYLKNVVGIPGSKLLHHPYEVAEARALQSDRNRHHSPRSESHLAFLYVGQLIPRKGVHLLLQACDELLKRGIDSFSLTIIGTGHIGRALRSEAALLGLESYVKWVGAVDYGDLGAYYEACDVFVFPTLEDTWGMVVLEAMVFGKPVLCSKYAGSREMVEHAGSGFVFDPLRVDELAGYMERLIREPILVTSFGLQSTKRIASHTPVQAAKSLSMLVDQVMERKGFHETACRKVADFPSATTSVNEDPSASSDFRLTR
jgi:glycosyltransferase involved in cell wall biosynthesis